MRNKLIPVVMTAVVTSLATMFIAAKFMPRTPYFAESPRKEQPSSVQFAAYTANGMKNGPADFQVAADISTKAVVHIKTKTNARTVIAYDPNDFFSQFFGPQQQFIPQQRGSGSGVVISQDGYIVTNNHVVAGADEVTVTFNDRNTVDAKVLATDASTDIAVLKVNREGLDYLEFGNSDDVKVGQWVLAAGYPLTLDATVTAGIVSAKGRSIGINRQQSETAIESFIQTDAAVNPGNSGGALVNTDGQLVGINSAIASPTGSYAGYSYAIPSNLVRKVVNDLVEYGTLQRAYLGVVFPDLKRISPEQMKEMGIGKFDGIYVIGVHEKSAADMAGIKPKDFITHINGVPVHTEPELQEQVARYKPGDKISVSYLRNGNPVTANVQLKNLEGTTSVIKTDDNNTKLLGAQFRPLSNEEKNKYDVQGGVQVTNAGRGALASANIKNGFVITSVNEQSVGSISELKKALSSGKNVQIAGFYPGKNGMYYYGLSGIDANELGE